MFKTFSCQLIFYPGFHKFQTSNQIKESITDWIIENSKNDIFEIKIINFENEVVYEWNSLINTEPFYKEVLFSSIYQPFGIHLSSSFDFTFPHNIEPAISLWCSEAEAMETFSLKYKEYDESKEEYVLISYGKKYGYLAKYTNEIADPDLWKDDFVLSDGISYDFNIRMQSEAFTKKSNQILEELYNLNEAPALGLKKMMDQQKTEAWINGIFVLKKENKPKFKYLLSKLVEESWKDDTMKILVFNVNFIPHEAGVFSIEKYNLTGIDDTISIKSISI